MTGKYFRTMLWLHNIVFFIPLLFFCFNAKAESPDSSKAVIYHFYIREEIGPPIWRQTQKAFAEAEKLNATCIIIHMNTYGGLVDAADSIRTKILYSRIPVYAFIDNNAASAGALIAIACDSIYMRSGANIGAATVVTADGTPAPDKYQAYMRATMRATAETHGKIQRVVNGDTTEVWFRDPSVAEAMVDPSIYIEGIIDTGKVLTFTVNEAIAHHYCEAMTENIEEIIERHRHVQYEIVEYKNSTLDKFINFLISPVIQGLLIMLIIGGIYFELQTPGIGFPLAAAIMGALLYFAPLYMEGLAENWEILIFVAGVILIAIEIFAIPGFGVTGIAGIILVFASFVLSMVDNIVFTYDNRGLPEMARAFAIVGASSLLSFIISIYLARRLITSPVLPGISLDTVQDTKEGFLSFDLSLGQLTGHNGIAFTDLRPAGKIEIEDEIYDAVAETGFIEKGKEITVVKFETGQLYVRKK